MIITESEVIKYMVILAVSLSIVSIVIEYMTCRFFGICLWNRNQFKTSIQALHLKIRLIKDSIANYFGIYDILSFIGGGMIIPTSEKFKPSFEIKIDIKKRKIQILHNKYNA